MENIDYKLLFEQNNNFNTNDTITFILYYTIFMLTSYGIKYYYNLD